MTPGKRALVLALATELGIGWRETKIWPDELRAADEVFLTSSVRGAMPVTTLDGQRVGAGGVGPVTRRILTRYQAYIDAVAGGADDLLR